MLRPVIVALLLLALLGCREEAKDREVLAELAGLPIVTVPEGGTELSREEVPGGGSDAAGIAGASAIRLTYATDRTPEEVAGWYQREYDASWRLHANGYARHGGAALVGALARDEASTVTIEAWEPTTADEAPPGSGAVVLVTVARTRD
ncbi:hypothetical protein GCM10009844_20980 [Nocardioides koreensis]|uniref:Lipoprotein n=1 Tax=Nocardioides koreensis TaxID=433651 RepID=A0ABP5LH72_9ACTN